MPETPIYKLQVALLNSDTVSLNSIARTPRIYKPQDLAVACQNTRIACAGDEPEPVVARFVHYLLIDFFVTAHRTGLYNRQRSLWESLSKVASVEVFQHKRGWFRRSPLPVFDIHLLDFKGRVLVFARLIEPGLKDLERSAERIFANFIRCAKRLSDLSGLFLCLPAPFPERILKRVKRMTNAADPVARYESLLPEPLAVPINLLTLDPGELPAGQESGECAAIKLVHPDLTPVRKVRSGTARTS